jgi:hypothetical protein
VVDRAANALVTVVERGLTAATNALNTRPKKKPAPDSAPPSAPAGNEGVANDRD